LEDHFNTLINGYIENKVGVAEFFIPDILATQHQVGLLGSPKSKQPSITKIGQMHKIYWKIQLQEWIGL
jgi:hypothetical protein